MPTTLVTGSASGIGAATVDALKAAGHTVIGVDLRNADITGDLSTAAGRQAVIAQALERSGGTLDGLVLCAGLGAQVQPASLIASVNYFGAVELLDGLLPALQKGQNPAAVVISSMEYAKKHTTNPARIAAISTVTPTYPLMIITATIIPQAVIMIKKENIIPYHISNGRVNSICQPHTFASRNKARHMRFSHSFQITRS